MKSVSGGDGVIQRTGQQPRLSDVSRSTQREHSLRAPTLGCTQPHGSLSADGHPRPCLLCPDITSEGSPFQLPLGSQKLQQSVGQVCMCVCERE